MKNTDICRMLPFLDVANLPEWVQWLAQDADGTWWGYEVEPLPSDSGWYENEVGRYLRLGQTNCVSDWRQALIRRSS